MLGRSYGRSWGACGAGYLTLIRFKPALSATIAIGNPKSCDRTTYPDDWIKLCVGLYGSGAGAVASGGVQPAARRQPHTMLWVRACQRQGSVNFSVCEAFSVSTHIG